MSTKKIIFILTVTTALFGCGRHYSGVYSGKEQITGGTTTTPQSSAMTLTLNDNGGSVSGTWQSAQGGAGTISASATADGLTSVQMIATTPGTYMTTYYSYWQTSACQQTFTGTLSAMNANQLTGTLIGTGGGCYTGTYNPSRTIDVSK